MKNVFHSAKKSIDALKLRYLDMLQDEGCLFEVLYDNPEWDERPQRLSLRELEKLISLVPDDVIAHQWDERFVA